MKPTVHYDINSDLRYLNLLSQSFPSVAAASTEIINLEAILNLPKGTEHFLADLHGEYQAFRHILKNASGNIKRKVNELFGSEIRESEKKELCTLIYYPEEKLELVESKQEIQEERLTDPNQAAAAAQDTRGREAQRRWLYIPIPSAGMFLS